MLSNPLGYVNGGPAEASDLTLRRGGLDPTG